ncbi:mannose-1-phosphate guanylyltransferase [Clostridium sediminicola]|uniref:mannose-1-phosphate guanylyltransferase n=1 Tax=Clostridium sediminicola TaxID=3114879 RepID=UPI0031F1E8B8
MICALVMAGGKGTRLLPLSTEEKPKQFLKLLGNETMIQMTVNRLKKLIPIERIFVVTGKRYCDLVKEQIPDLPDRNIIKEPVGKNTAPCIILSAFIINKYYKDATLAVLPSDHLIKDEDKFLETLKVADEFIKGKDESIVTLGMKPNRAEIGYGYISYDKESESIGKFNIHEVNKFVEKPNKETAEKYLARGNYLWNAGMFIWKTSTILNLSQKFLNNTFNILKEVTASSEAKFQNMLDNRYNEVHSISVDYGIMENAESIFVIPSQFGWDDVGTWKAIERYRSKDTSNNIFVGDVTNISGKNNVVLTKGKPIILDEVDDVLIVESDDVIFIGHKGQMEIIKEIRASHEAKG